MEWAGSDGGWSSSAVGDMGVRVPLASATSPSPPPPFSSMKAHWEAVQQTHRCTQTLTLQAWASSMAALRASRGFSMTRPAWPEKSMATRVLSETLLWEEDRRRRGAVRIAALNLYPYLS